MECIGWVEDFIEGSLREKTELWDRWKRGESGVPHSIQRLNPDGCEFLLVFDDGDFDEDDTFLLKRRYGGNAWRSTL
jgi:hypothetical protein